jgi:hypothetical protein
MLTITPVFLRIAHLVAPVVLAMFEGFIESNPLGRRQDLIDFRLEQGPLDGVCAEGFRIIRRFSLNIITIFRVGQERRVQRCLGYLNLCPGRAETVAISRSDLFELLFLILGQIQPIPEGVFQTSLMRWWFELGLVRNVRICRLGEHKLVAEIKARKGKTILFIRFFKSDLLRINNLLVLFGGWKKFLNRPPGVVVEFLIGP